MDEKKEAVAGRIVVGVDGSESSKHALRWAHFLAGVTNAEVEAVSAWSPPVNWAGGGWAVPPIDWDPAEYAAKSLNSTVAEVLGSDAPNGVHATILEGSAAKVLLELSQNAQMLVVGSRGHGGFAGLLLGSVSTACAEHAACPVLIVHGEMAVPVQR